MAGPAAVLLWALLLVVNAGGTAGQGLSCPASGTSVAYSDGRHLRWAGTLSGDTSLCLGEERVAASTRQVRRLFGLIDLPSPDEATLRSGLMALMSGEPGLSFALTPSDAPQTREEWRREPGRLARFLGREIITLRLSRTRTWPRTGAFLQLIYTFDPATGVLLHMSGAAGTPEGAGLITPVSAVSLMGPP